MKVYHQTTRATYYEVADRPGLLYVVYAGRGSSPGSLGKVKNNADGRAIIAALKKNVPGQYRLHYRCPVTGVYPPHRGSVRMARAKVIDIRRIW